MDNLTTCTLEYSGCKIKMHSRRPVGSLLADSKEVKLSGSSIHRTVDRSCARICKVLFNSHFSFANEMTASAEFKPMEMDFGASRSLSRASL